MGESREWLIGEWATDPDGTWSTKEYGRVFMRFSRDGRLRYSIEQSGRQQVMNLTYRVEGNQLITDQPSHPAEERSEFCVMEDGRLGVRNLTTSRMSYYVKLGLVSRMLRLLAGSSPRPW